jgi:hypothetical protein
VALSRETQNILVRRASALAALSKHPSWPELEEEVSRKIERLRKAALVVALSDQGADQRKLDMIRGTIGALNWLVGVPKRSEHSLEEYLREQGLEVPDE